MDAKIFATADSIWSETYTLTQSKGGPPIDLTGVPFRFVIRPSVTDATSPALVHVDSTGATSQGSITITPLTGTVYVQLTPAATLLLGRGTYAYALWANPTDPALRNCWLKDTFVTSLAAQP